MNVRRQIKLSSIIHKTSIYRGSRTIFNDRTTLDPYKVTVPATRSEVQAPSIVKIQKQLPSWLEYEKDTGYSHSKEVIQHARAQRLRNIRPFSATQLSLFNANPRKIATPSRKNDIVRHLWKLRVNATYRKTQDKRIVTSSNIVKHMLKHTNCAFNNIFTTQRELVDTLVAEDTSRERYNRVQLVDKDILQYCLRGTTAAFKLSDTIAEVILPKPAIIKQPKLVIALDNVRYPENIGNIIRTAVALNVDAIFYLKGTADPFDWKVSYITGGLQFMLPYQKGDIRALKKFCKNHKLTPIVAHLEGKEVDQLKITQGICLILSNESHGPDADILKFAKSNCWCHSSTPTANETLQYHNNGKLLKTKMAYNRTNNDDPKTHLLSGMPDDSISHISWSHTPNPLLLAASSWDKTVRIWRISPIMGNTVTSESVILYRQEAPVLTSCFSTDTSKFFAGGCTNTVMAYDLASRNPTGILVAKHDKPVTGVYWIQKFNAIMTTSWDGKVCMWDGRQSQPVWCENLGTKIFASHFRPNIACVAGSNGKIHAWNLDNIQHPKSRVTLDSTLKCQVRAMCLFPNVTDKSGLVYTSIGGRAVVSYFMEENKSQNFSFKCHRQDSPGKSTQIYAVNAVDFHNVHGTFVTGGGDGNFTIWDKEHRSRVKTFNNVDSPIVDVKIQSDTNLLAYATSYDWYKGFDREMIMKSRRQIGVMQLREEDVKGRPKTVGAMEDARRNWIVNTQVLYNFISCIRLPHQPLSVEFLPELSWRRERIGDVAFQHVACGLQAEPGEKVALYVIEVALPAEPLKEGIRRYSQCIDYEGFPLPGYGEPMYQCVSKASLEGDVSSLRSHSYGEKSFLAAKAKDVYVYDIGSGIKEDEDMKPILTFNDHEKEGYGLTFHKTNPILGSCSEDGIVNIWNVEAGALTYNFQHQDVLNAIEFLDHENRVLVAAEDGHVLVLDFDQPEPVAKTAQVTGAINAITNHALNPDVFVTGSTTGVVHVWDYRKLDKPLHEFKAHDAPIVRLQLNNSCPTLLASAAEDNTVRIFDLEAGCSDEEEDEYMGDEDQDEEEDDPKELIFTHTGHVEQVYDFCWSTCEATDTFVASVGEDFCLQIWQMSDDIMNYSDEEDEGDEQ
ncbi:Protein RAE1 [Babesia sp. Xinjiang]|uniref:Protein RAE1 n=1 Tax=Babesia sp. Xinjiang TaxID=462227 RepID=UPI000A2519A8|nr:Protein RAE1 [Babesia sp. Xinjiang]ORM40318.1 Protein RAE1 [Babesia sp. Xinjiang]